MVWPTTPLGVRVDLQVGGAWTDVTPDVLVRDGITITRGRADEATRADAQRCNLTLKNQSGKYSPRNPQSPYYGILGRNAPLRVGIGTPPLGAATAGQSGTSIVAPSVTAETAGAQYVFYVAAPGGDITIPAGFSASLENDGSLATARSGGKQIAAGATGTATATYSVAATSAAALTVVVPGVTSSAGVSATLPGGGGFTTSITGVTPGQYLLALYGWSSDPDDRMPAVADAEGGNEWLLIADSGASAGPRVKAYIRRIVTTTGTVRMYYWGDNRGTIDVFGTTWTLTGTTEYYPRFVGEVSQWPPKWDLSGKDVFVPIQASGVTRRLAGGAGGASPLQSALTRQLARTNSVVAYWPMEDDEGATSFASGLSDGAPMTFTGAPVLAAYDGFDCSSPIPTFTAAGGYGTVPAYTATNEFSLGALTYLPPTGMTDESTMFTVRCTGSVRTWTLKYDTGLPGVRLEGFNAQGVSVLSRLVGPWTPTLLDAKYFWILSIVQQGADILYVIRGVPIISSGDGTGVSTYLSGTVTGQTVGAVTSVSVGAVGDLAGAPAIGQVVLTSLSAALFAGNVWSALGAYRGENATDRFMRLCQEERVPAAIQGYVLAALMGPQRPGTLLDLISECEVADDGVVYEPKGFIGLGYRPRSSKYNQVAELTLSYAAGQISAPFEPTDDDQGVVNDVRVSRVNGSSARAELTSGPMSTRPPPAGIGRYNSDTPLNVNADSQLPDQASWRLHVGTWNEARYPSVRVNLAKNPTLVPAATAVDTGDMVSLTNLPTWVPPGPVDLILEGYTETIRHPVEWDLTGNYSPAGPYRVGVYDATAWRYSPDASSLASGATSTAPTLSVATPSGPLWTTAAGSFPFDIVVAGEQMTVTGIAGTTSPQTFTVTRSVNGVVKTQTAGAAVALYRPAVYAL